MLERGRAFRHPRPRRHGAHARGGSQDRLRALHGRPARSSTATHHQAERVDGPAKQGVARRFADRPVRLQRTASSSRLTSLGSSFLAASAEVNGASRSNASPDFVGPPWLALRAEESREGTSPENDRAPESKRNRPGSPRRPRIWAALRAPTPGTERKMSAGSRARRITSMRCSSSWISFQRPSARVPRSRDRPPTP